MSTESIIARLILSTGRKNRPFDLVTVYNDFKYLLNNGYSVVNISKLLGISAGMVNKFLRVEKISPDLINLLKNRTIDSVALVHNLAKFSYNEQKIIVQSLEEGKLTTHDVRALSPLRKSNPEVELPILINRLTSSKDQKVSVIRIPCESLKKNISDFEEIVKEIIKEENFERIESNMEFFDLKMSKKGELLLRKHAKTKKISLNELINELLK